MGVTRQPVVQPHLQVHHGQGHLGRHGVQEVQRVRHEVAERHGADCTALVINYVLRLLDSTVVRTNNFVCLLMAKQSLRTAIGHAKDGSQIKVLNEFLCGATSSSVKARIYDRS